MSMLDTQSRKASLMASFRIRVPSVTACTVAPKPLHPENIGPLPLHIDLAHVYGAFESEFCRHGGRGDAVLPGPGFGDDPPLAHPPDEQPLPHDVIGFMGAGVVEVFPLDVDFRTAEMPGEIFAVRERRGAAGIASHEGFVRLPEGGVILRRPERMFEFVKRGHQDLRQEGPPELVIISAIIHRIIPPMVWEKTYWSVRQKSSE